MNHFDSLVFGIYNSFINLKSNHFCDEFNNTSINKIGEALIDVI